MTNKDNHEPLNRPWRECIEQTWEAYTAGFFPIGAIITGKDGRTVANGRNRNFEPTAPPPISPTAAWPTPK